MPSNPNITAKDLIAWIGGDHKCRSQEVADYISEQREIIGSPIRQWYEDFVRKCDARPEDIDWGCLFLEELSEGFGAGVSTRSVTETGVATRQELGANVGADSAAADIQALRGSVFTAREQGDLELALRYATEMHGLAVAEFGADSIECSDAASLIGSIHALLGNLDTAKTWLSKALSIRYVKRQEGHPDVTESLNNLGYVLLRRGDYAAAEPLLVKALTGCTQMDAVARVICALQNLVMLYIATGRREAAQERYRELLELRGKRRDIGDSTPSFLTVGFEEVYDAMVDVRKGRSIVSALDSLRQRLFGQQDVTNIARNLARTAWIWKVKGNPESALETYSSAIELVREKLGEANPEFVEMLTDEARLLASLTYTSAAIERMRRAVAIGDELLERVFWLGPTERREKYLHLTERQLSQFFTLILSQGQNVEAAAADVALESVMQRKMLLTQAPREAWIESLKTKYPQFASDLVRLGRIQLRLAEKTWQGAGVEGLEGHRSIIGEWNAQRMKLEAELARSIPEIDFERRLRSAERRAVRLALTPGVALVEFVRVDIYEFASCTWNENVVSDARYVALVVQRDLECPQVVDVGRAAVVEQAMRAFRGAATQGAVDEAQTVLGPVVEYLIGQQAVYISPADMMEHVPWGSIISAGGREDCIVKTLSRGGREAVVGLAP